jgi:hypothetical protein
LRCAATNISKSNREHAADEREMLSEHVHNDNASSASAAVDRVLNTLWGMLSGVCRRQAIAC